MGGRGLGHLHVSGECVHSPPTAHVSEGPCRRREKEPCVDGRDRGLHLALRVRDVHLEAAELLLLDGQLERAEWRLWVHQPSLRRTRYYPLPGGAAGTDG